MHQHVRKPETADRPEMGECWLNGRGYRVPEWLLDAYTGRPDQRTHEGRVLDWRDCRMHAVAAAQALLMLDLIRREHATHERAAPDSRDTPDE